MKVWVCLLCFVAAAAAFGQGREFVFGWDTGVWGSCASAEKGKGAWHANDFSLREYD
jgi:hypothetical protein